VLARFTPDGWDHRPIAASAGDLAVTETALYDVTLDSPTDWQLVTTGSRIAQTELPDGMQRERFVSGPQRDFFVAALQGLEQQSLTVDDTHIISYYQPDNPFTGEQSLDVAARAWQCFRQRYGSNPLQEVEIIQAALTGFIGVEYPGVMLIEQTLYWENDEVLESTVAHEISHQWWYNLVGNDARREPWIDEGLASFSQIVYDECRGNEAHATSTFLHYQKQYRQAEQAGRGGAINQSVEALQGKYYSIAYARSALFFAALRAQLGNETFYQFLRRYAEEYRYRVASGDDLLAMAEATCDCDLQAFADEWMER
jgi:aminopeptidase N